MTSKETLLDAQTCVIGCMMLWPEKYAGQIFNAVQEKDFSDPTFRNIYTVARGIFLEGRPVDPVLIVDKLGKEYAQTVADAMEMTPTAGNLSEYIKLLREERQFREIRGACMDIATLSEDLPHAREMLAKAAELLVDIQDDRDKTWGELVSALLDRQNDPTPPDYLDWGIEQINRVLKVSPGKFVVLGADSSVGKTAIAIQFALSFAKAGKRVGFFSYETDDDDLTERGVSNEADVSMSRTMEKKLTATELRKIVDMAKKTYDLPLRIIESEDYTVEKLRAKTLARQFDVIFVDYVQLIPTHGPTSSEQVRKISMDLHRLARSLGVVVVGLSQVTVPEKDKQGRRRYITPDDLRESRQLKQDADVILLLDLSDPRDRHSVRVLQIAKNKKGDIGHLTLNFDPHRMRFTYCDTPLDLEQTEAKERTDKMDANREERLRKEAEKNKNAIPGQGLFSELSDDDGPLPF